MDERASEQTVQFGALGNQDVAAQRSETPLEAQTVQFDAVGAAPPSAALTSPPASPRRRNRLAVGALGVVVGLAAVVVVTALLMHGDSGKPSDQQQVASAIRGYYAVERDKGLAAASAISCREVRDASVALPQSGGMDFKQDVTVEKIDGITIDGDAATAKLTAHAQTVMGSQTQTSSSDTIQVNLKRENGTWRFCTMQE